MCSPINRSFMEELVLSLVSMHVPIQHRWRCVVSRYVQQLCAIDPSDLCAFQRVPNGFRAWKRRTLFPRRSKTRRRPYAASWRRRLHHADDPILPT